MPGYFDLSEGMSPNAAQDYGSGPGSDVLTRLWQSLFARRQPSIDQEVDQWSRYGANQAPTDSGRFPPADRPPAPLSKPATKITSANDIASKISALLGQPQAPPQVDFPDWSRTFGRADAGFRDSLPMPPVSEPVNIPIPLGNPPAQPQPSFGGRGLLEHIFGIPRGVIGQAQGGPIPMMRGGYPELYDRPIRQGHFSTGGGGGNYVRPDGSGDGRSDHVEARLSPGEYVMDAEAVSMLGNGDNDAGARKLDKMRSNLRKQKGKALAKGKFSPNAKKDAMEYLAHDGVSDGLRRRGRERE